MKIQHRIVIALALVAAIIIGGRAALATNPAGSMLPAGHITADGVATGTTRLSTMPVTGLPSFATRAWVKSVGDWFVLGPAVGSAQANVVVTAADGRQWVRAGYANRAYTAAPFWAVDPANSTGLADDEGLGWGASRVVARSHPLRTIAELNRRLVGAETNGTIIIEQLSNQVGDFPRLMNLNTIGFNGFIAWEGVLTSPVFSGTVSAYAAEAPASNTRSQLTVTGIGTASLAGKLVKNAAGTKAAWIQKTISADVVGTTVPSTSTAEAFGGTTVAFTVGETVNVYVPVTLTDYPFSPNVIYAGLDSVSLTTPATHEVNLGQSAAYIVNVKLTNVILRGGGARLFNDLFAGACTLYNQTSFIGWSGLATGGLLSAVSGLIECDSRFDIQASRLELAGSVVWNTAGSASGFSIFDCTDTGHAPIYWHGTAFGAASLRSSLGKVYGAGNTSYIIRMSSGNTSTIPVGANWTVTTSAANALEVSGVGYDITSVPIAVTTSGTFLTNGQ